jgi:hypothetical protein
MRIKAEVDQLDMAMKAFKQTYGDYPPCDLRITSSYPNPRLRAFVAKAFPRFAQSNSSKPDRLKEHLVVAGVDTDNFDPARALVFWLSGFNPDVTSPFAVAETTPTGTPTPYTGERTPLYGFDKTRLLVAGTTTVAATGVQPGGMWYVPSGGQNAPFVYFDYRSYSTNPSSLQPASVTQFTHAAFQGTAQPYALDVDNSRTLVAGTDTWANPETFQIISAGQDGHFGAMATTPTPIKLYPIGVNYTTEDNDNVTNFADKSSLEDAKP